MILSQQAHLFSATVRRNLLIGRPDASEGDLRQALRTARALEFVEELPEGLDTWVGEGGNRLSTGQARRLAAARAVLKDAPVWVLDEPTEGLDRVTEAALVESLFEATRRRTVVWITHRMVNLQAMDAVVVLQAGRVTDRGTRSSGPECALCRVAGPDAVRRRGPRGGGNEGGVRHAARAA